MAGSRADRFRLARRVDETSVFTPGATDQAGPIVAKLPDSDAIMPCLILRSRAHHVAQDPESAHKITLLGSLDDSS